MKTGFMQNLLALNGIEQNPGFDCWLFFEGMLFGSTKTWWAGKGLRPQSHEGLDLCFFADRRGRFFRLDETVRIPAAFDSRVEAIIPDFLGTTVIAAHQRQTDGKRQLIFYAHTAPDKNLQTGQHLYAGQSFAVIAPPHQKRLLPPHLHLSMADAENLPPVKELQWPLLNRLDRALFADPLQIFDSSHRVIGFNPKLNLYEVFVPAGLCSSPETVCRKYSGLYETP